MRRFVCYLIVLCCLTACGSKEEPVRYEPIVVKASYADEDYLPGLFAGFTAETGIPVVVSYDSSDVHATNLIFNIGSTPADIFLSRDVVDLWRAADEGALRPIAAPNLEKVPDTLRDLDGLWTAIAFRPTVIVHGRNVNEPLPAGLLDFAATAYKGRLCVGSSALAANRLVLAMMIEDHGSKQTERAVRHWMRNLAAAPIKSEEGVLAAVEAGDCEFGIVSGWQRGADLGVITPQPAYLQIEGIGVARHSRYPDAAQKLVEWMLSEPINQRHAQAQNGVAANGAKFNAEAGQAPAVAGWNDEQARLLAERAGYR